MSTSSASFSALKATAQARKRSVRLFDGVGPVPFGMEKRPSKYALGLSDEPDPDDLLVLFLFFIFIFYFLFLLHFIEFFFFFFLKKKLSESKLASAKEFLFSSFFLHINIFLQ